MLTIRPYTDSDEMSVVSLWHICGLIVPWNDPHKDIRRKQMVQPEMFLVAEDAGMIVATVMAGYEGHRGWINYLAVHPDHRRIGLGKRLMDEAENRLRLIGCPKICLQVRSNNADVIAFYEQIGFKRDDVIGFGKRLESDE